jgi:hypothetical protein
MKKLLSLCALSILLISCKQSVDVQAEDIDILQLLQAVDGVEAHEIDPKNGFERQFEVYIDQPLDHNNPDGPLFRQRVFISHNDIRNPVIFMPSGYSSSPVKVCELSQPLGANQVYAAHRFMAGAQPDNRDWEYLTIQQASSDFHRVVELLNGVYKGTWVSYGISKNGQAALFHRRFYPEDVNGTVCLGSPLSEGVEDPRYDIFLAQVGTAECRKKIRQFQRILLQNRIQVQKLIIEYMKQSEFIYSRMNESEILEFETLEYPFSFWQVTNGDCSEIPDSTSSALELFNHIKNFGYLDFYSDEMLAYYEPVYYQAYTELGWYRLIDDDLKDLLTSAPSYRQMAPHNVNLEYNPAVLQDINDWLTSHGNNIIYIYGANDPWTAGAIKSVGATNAIKIIQEGANHTISIEDLDDRNLVYAKIYEWLDIQNPGSN